MRPTRQKTPQKQQQQNMQGWGAGVGIQNKDHFWGSAVRVELFGCSLRTLAFEAVMLRLRSRSSNFLRVSRTQFLHRGSTVCLGGLPSVGFSLLQRFADSFAIPLKPLYIFVL